jgi:choline dehydrogenase-like flavoprotein
MGSDVAYGPDTRLFSGTFKTPQLLELSGIGDRNLLKSFGIETLIDLPGVGENLLDQTYTLIDYVAKKHVKTLGKSQLSLVVNYPFSRSTVS